MMTPSPSPSPDPPRQQETDDVQESFANFGIFEVVEDDIMGEGEHELDYSSNNDNDSNFSDGFESDLDDRTVDGHIHDLETRGHYRVLIPFQVETVPSINDEDDDEEIGENENSLHTHSIQNTQENHEFTSQTQEPSREIIITEDKAEVIKNVMKQFTLPQSAIPPWAQEITEDSWKNKIKASLDQTNQQGPSSTS